MAFTYYPQGADPDPWTLYPDDPEDPCSSRSPPITLPNGELTRFICTRFNHDAGSLHVARNGDGVLCATWMESDSDKKGPDEIVDSAGRPLEQPKSSPTRDFEEGDQIVLLPKEKVSPKEKQASCIYDIHKPGDTFTFVSTFGPHNIKIRCTNPEHAKEKRHCAMATSGFHKECYALASPDEVKKDIKETAALAKPNLPEGAKECKCKGEHDGKHDHHKLLGHCGRWMCTGCGICWECYSGELPEKYCPNCAKYREMQLAAETPKKEMGMAEPKTKTEQDKERAGIVYGERVTFRVDEGKEIVIQNEDESILWLQRRKEEREKEVAFVENIDGSFPSDGMIALARVLRREYGFTKFDSPTPWGVPVVLSIPVGPHGEMQDAPWGKFSVPGLNGFIQTAINKDKTGQPIFQLAARIKNKDKDIVKRLANLVRKDLEVNSVYRGHAIKVEFPDFRRVAFDPTVHVPTFLDVSKADPKKLVFSREVQNAVETSIFTHIQFSKRVKKEVGTLKRGVLLGGKPGTGKTLAAHVTAKLCEENGWTFIYLANTGDLAQAIGFAKMYQPAVIFAEDLDSIVNTYAEDNDRDAGTMAVLNTLDGIDSKNGDVLVVFTTNYPEKLPEAMTRPGRLDAIITVLPPDSEAVERLMRLYGNGLMSDLEDLDEVAQSLAGEIPAVIREVVDRSKLVAIRHTPDHMPLRITAADLVVARDSMKSHLRMLNEKRLPPPSDIEKAAHVVMHYVTQAAKSAVQGSHGLHEHDESGDCMEGEVTDRPAEIVKAVAAQLPQLKE